MRTKVTLVLIFLNVALFFFIFKFERSWRTEEALREARRRVLGSETTSIRTLSVTTSLPGVPSYALQRNRDTWVLTEPLDWPANQHAVSALLNALQFLENDTSFSVADLPKSGMSLADYGLDKPKMTVTFTSTDAGAVASPGQNVAGPTTVLQIGDATQVGNRLYVLSPDGARVHVVSRALLEAFSVPLDQLRADTLFTIEVFETKALAVQTSGARVRIRRDGTRWIFDTIVNARASKLEMDVTINDLNGLRASSFPTTAPSVLPSASPALRVTLDGNARSETLLLGEPVKPSEATADAKAGGAAKTEFFAQLMNNNTVRAPVFTVAVPNKLLERLRNASTELRDRRILELEPAAVTSITIAAPTQNQASVTLQRLDSNVADSPWQLVRRSDGGEQTVPADTAAVRRLLERLALLAAERFESDAPSNAQTEAWGFNRPEREISLVMAAAPGVARRTDVLQLGTDSAGAVYARLAGTSDAATSVYQVNVDLANELPVDPKLWRSRVLNELPATARIASLKLTDLSNNEVVFEAALDPSGEAQLPAREPAAVKALVDSLRVLRAKRIVQESFAERMLLAGDERTWRYRLDAVVALPGGGADQARTSTLFLTERLGGAQQVAGSKQLDVVFEVEQPMLDALWSLAYGQRDPGPQLEKK